MSIFLAKFLDTIEILIDVIADGWVFGEEKYVLKKKTKILMDLARIYVSLGVN